ncbi:MAG: phosphatidylglycerol lysyltransferase domain-containing protein [Elusimicrobia bacterium]|nr:phosphatidylglycerol lysyltransferase domain-containing protein [Elusimicrobiota bacterium]
MNPIPEYPKKRFIELEDKPLFDNLFKKYPPVISEFSFVTLFAWRCSYQFAVSTLEDYIIISFIENDVLKILDPIGETNSKKKDIILKCFSLQPKNNIIKFTALPEDTITLFRGTTQFIIKEDRNDFDYVYLTKDLTELKGKGFDSKRNFIRRFKNSYPFTYKKLTNNDIKKCISFMDEWCLLKDCQHKDGLSKERKAIKYMLENFEYLNIKSGIIEIDAKIIAVSMGEALNSETFVVHIEKANSNFIGIYQAINQMFCESEASGYKYINREQDLGVPGLRKAKESYHPFKMIKKYTLSLKD